MYESNCGANEICLATECVRACSEQRECPEGTACRGGGCTEGALEFGVDAQSADAAVDAELVSDAAVDAAVEMPDAADVVDADLPDAADAELDLSVPVDGGPADSAMTDQGQVSDASLTDAVMADGGIDLGPVDDLAGLYALTTVVEEVEGGAMSAGDQIHRIARLVRVQPGQYDVELRDQGGEVVLEAAALRFVAPEVDRYQYELAFPVAGRLGCVEVRFERGQFEGQDLLGRQTRDTESRGGDCSGLLVHARLTTRWHRIGD